jgi:hypothetical protein
MEVLRSSETLVHVWTTRRYIPEDCDFLEVEVEVEVNLRPTVSRPLSWCQAPIFDPRPIFISPRNFLETVEGLLFCSALSDERTGL